MTKRFFLLLMPVLSLCVSCSGMIEQPGFISIFSGIDDGITLKSFEQSQDNEISLIFEGSADDLKIHALKDGEKAVCSIQKLEPQENEDSNLSIFKVIPLVQFKIGEDFKICGTIKSGLNQSLDFELPFKGANNNPAELVFSALKVGSTSNPGFIKFQVKKRGNLFGFELLNTGNSKEADYTFPPFEVEEGKIIVYHWFLPIDGSEPEDGSLASSHGCNALEQGEEAICFWGKFKKFTPKKTNAVLIKQPYTGEIQDAVLFRNPTDENWGKPEVEYAANQASEKCLWKPDGDISNAVQANITPAKMIKRVSLELINHNAGDWSLTSAPKK